ncbi:UNKNOWN [Stylonychia lemnae]|uniref:Uncharacterized protein n=1 Tax=Stylonychia lemnae TaxID=5949 RepID=A0A078AEF1_STYLE|nr:UNKNOWN [Stylonychia lemnae]|eukprot:CDW80644.1 UNKNOWN [Stylonychia lemnae]
MQNLSDLNQYSNQIQINNENSNGFSQVYQNFNQPSNNSGTKSKKRSYQDAQSSWNEKINEGRQNFKRLRINDPADQQSKLIESMLSNHNGYPHHQYNSTQQEDGQALEQVNHQCSMNNENDQYSYLNNSPISTCISEQQSSQIHSSMTLQQLTDMYQHNQQYDSSLENQQLKIIREQNLRMRQRMREDYETKTREQMIQTQQMYEHEKFIVEQNYQQINDMLRRIQFGQ